MAPATRGEPEGRTRGGARPGAELTRLVYISFATRELTPEDVAQIESRSQSHNLALSITGLLIVHGSFFYSIMEGPRRRLMQRMEVIIADGRHRGLRILREERIDSRRFANWSFARLPESSGHRFDEGTPGRFILDLSRRLA